MLLAGILLLLLLVVVVVAVLNVVKLRLLSCVVVEVVVGFARQLAV